MRLIDELKAIDMDQRVMIQLLSFMNVYEVAKGKRKDVTKAMPRHLMEKQVGYITATADCDGNTWINITIIK